MLAPNFRITPDERQIIRANFLRGNSRRVSGRILCRTSSVIGAIERAMGLYRGGKLRGRKQSPEHIARRVLAWRNKLYESQGLV